MGNIFFTSDQHYFHEKIITSCNRPFVNAEIMNEELIKNHNDVVSKNDTVYMLGDVAHRYKDKDLNDVLNRLNGTFHLILGNHDRYNDIVKTNRFSTIKDISYLKIDNIKIMLCHYPIRSWNCKKHGAWHLYGHEHGNISDYGFSFDVGVDCWNYTPISWDKVREIMNGKAQA